MTGNKYLIDTSVVIEVFSGNKEIADKINKLSGFYISTVVLGELYIGINRVANKAKHLKVLTSFLTLCEVLSMDNTTALHYGEIIAGLFKKGKPIPTNDVWIAALAIQNDLTLVTRDKHFKEIEGLKVKNW